MIGTTAVEAELVGPEYAPGAAITASAKLVPEAKNADFLPFTAAMLAVRMFWATAAAVA